MVTFTLRTADMKGAHQGGEHGRQAEEHHANIAAVRRSGFEFEEVENRETFERAASRDSRSGRLDPAACCGPRL
jgi:hypothetical protein